ncbi:Protein tramtrack, alpha isoform [Gryllus bimaculatus]|nr:Protein tramtrack, alpha isoform [Gryllus bimaculatus]
MAESVVTVNWKDHTSELATEFKSLLDTNSFVDCTISAEGQSLQAHRLVLSTCSPYFHKLFCEETEDHPLVILLDESFQNLKAVIDFMYLGVIQIPQGNYGAFVTLAKSLEVKGLSHVANNPPGSTTENVPRDPSAKNQVIGEVPAINASQKDRSENNSQKIAYHSDDNTDLVDTHSPVSSKGNSALCDVRPKSKITPSRELGRPQAPSMKNQVTSEVKGINASQKDSSQNNSLKIAHCLDGNTDLVDSCSPLSVKGNSALRELRPKSVMTPSQKQGNPQGILYLQVQPSLYAPILGAKNQLLGKSNESLSRNITSQMGGGTASVHGQVFLVSGAGSLPSVGLQAAQQLSGGSHQNTTLLQLPVHDATSSNPTGHKNKRKKKHITMFQQKRMRSECSSDPKLWKKWLDELLNEEEESTSEESDSDEIAHLTESEHNTDSEQSSDDDGTSDGALYLQVQPGLYAAISGASNQLVVKSDESLSRNFTSQMGCGSASVQGQVFLISGAGSLPPVGLQAAQLLSGGSQQNTMLLLREGPFLSSTALTPTSNLSGHKPKQKKRLTCKVCGVSCNAQANLIIHERTHTGERPFLCDVCGATFSTSGILTCHIRTHTGERPYECDFCGKTFRQKSNLNLHLPLHTGKYPHRCDVCGKTFLQNQEFIEHKNLHTGERPNRCDVCGIAFRRAQNLRVHKLRHTGKWPYRCDI